MGFMDKVKDLLSKNAEKVDGAINKAGDVVDEKTQGKYKDTVDKVQDAAKKAVDKGGQPGQPGPTGNPPPPGNPPTP